jgi:signal transduction histidine kinase
MGIISEKETAKLMQSLGITMANYLSVSIGSIDMLTKKFEKSEEDYETIDHLAMVRHAQFELLNIADNMRELGTDALGETYLQLYTVNINDLCYKLIKSIEAFVDEIGIKLTFNRSSIDIMLTADYVRIEKMLISLLANSIGHCESGDSIQLSVTFDEENVYLSLADNGVGIDSQTLPILFDDYLKDVEAYDANKGAGLGMSVCESIARQHGGSLVVTSASGSGTIVTVSLPRVHKAFLGMATGGQYGSYKNWNILTGLAPVLSHKKYTRPFN